MKKIIISSLLFLQMLCQSILGANQQFTVQHWYPNNTNIYDIYSGSSNFTGLTIGSPTGFIGAYWGKIKNDLQNHKFAYITCYSNGCYYNAEYIGPLNNGQAILYGQTTDISLTQMTSIPVTDKQNIIIRLNNGPVPTTAPPMPTNFAIKQWYTKNPNIYDIYSGSSNFTGLKIESSYNQNQQNIVNDIQNSKNDLQKSETAYITCNSNGCYYSNTQIGSLNNGYAILYGQTNDTPLYKMISVPIQANQNIIIRLNNGPLPTTAPPMPTIFDIKQWYPTNPNIYDIYSGSNDFTRLKIGNSTAKNQPNIVKDLQSSKTANITCNSNGCYYKDNLLAPLTNGQAILYGQINNTPITQMISVPVQANQNIIIRLNNGQVPTTAPLMPTVFDIKQWDSNNPNIYDVYSGSSNFIGLTIGSKNGFLGEYWANINNDLQNYNTAYITCNSKGYYYNGTNFGPLTNGYAILYGQTTDIALTQMTSIPVTDKQNIIIRLNNGEAPTTAPKIPTSTTSSGVINLNGTTLTNLEFSPDGKTWTGAMGHMGNTNKFDTCVIASPNGAYCMSNNDHIIITFKPGVTSGTVPLTVRINSVFTFPNVLTLNANASQTLTINP